MSHTATDPDFLKLLCCPVCSGEIQPESPESLKCSGAESHNFPIVHDIPRFAGESYIQSFGIQWNRYDVVRTEMDLLTFEAKTGMHPAKLKGLNVLDAGVGGGRYARLVGEQGGIVVGLDLSSAVEKARANTTDLKNVFIAQADLLNPPLKSSVFDFAYSIGVLHHCPNPREAFRQVAKAVRPGGQLAVWLYRRNTLPQEILNTLLRMVTTRLPDRLLRGWARLLTIPGGIPLIKQSLSKIINFSTFQDAQLRLCDNYDWYAPKYQSHHTLEELRKWFLEEGFEEPLELRPEKRGSFYEWAYDHNLIIGSGVNLVSKKRSDT